MHRIWLAVALVGCSFDPGAPPGADDPDPATDGGVLDPVCSVSGTILCLELEQDEAPMAQALDGSGNQHHASATGVISSSNGSVDMRSGIFVGDSKLTVPATPNLDLVDNFTIEMWVLRVNAVPDEFRYFLLDSSGQYSLSIDSDDRLACSVNDGGKDVTSNEVVPIDGQFHHVACTYDQASGGELKVYVDGVVSDCEPDVGTIGERPGDTTIGVRTGSLLASEYFVGSLDNVHVYGTTLTPAQVCTTAGQAGCEARCPSKRDGFGFGGH